MKIFILSAIALMIAAGTASANLLIGWDGGDTSSTNMTGITGTLGTGGIVRFKEKASSNDGTYGPTITGASTDPNNAYAYEAKAKAGNDTLRVQIINGTGQELSLDKLVFDYGRWNDASPANVTIRYGYGDLEVVGGTEIQTIAGTVKNWVDDYDDFEIALTGLSDYVLADGEKATFELVVSNASDNTFSSGLDNVGFTGSVIPEPAAMGMLGLGAFLLLAIRRRLN
jgi:hypothetical protein